MAQLDAATDTYSGAGLVPVYKYNDDSREEPVNLAPNKTWLQGQPIGRVGTAASSVQTITITGTPTGGTFTLTTTLDGVNQTTAPIAYNATSATVLAALTSLGVIGPGGATATGGAFPGTPVVVTFAGKNANRAIPLLTANSAGLTGGSSPTVTPALTTPGVSANTFDVAADSTNPAMCLLRYGGTTDASGNFLFGGASPFSATSKYATAYFCGNFYESEIPALTANRLTELGARRISGVAGSGIIRIG